VVKQRKTVWGFSGKTLVGEEMACEAELLAMLGNR
jgi:hypothetical protein